MYDDGLGIRRRLKDRAFAHQFGAQRACVGEIAVVGDRDAAARKDRRTSAECCALWSLLMWSNSASWPTAKSPRRSLRRVAALPEHVADEAEMPLGDELALVEGDDPRGFLAAMLERMQAKNTERPRVGMAENAGKRRTSSCAESCPHQRDFRVRVMACRWCRFRFLRSILLMSLSSARRWSAP